MGDRHVSIVPRGGDALTFEVGPEKFSTDIERAGEELLQCLKNPNMRVICVTGLNGFGRWRIVEYAARKLKESDLFDKHIMVKIPETADWSPRNIQREILHQLGKTEGVCGDDDEEDDSKMDLLAKVSLKIFESLNGGRFLLILGDVIDCIDLDTVGVPNIKKVFAYDSKVVYVSTNRWLKSEERIELKDLSIDVLREEAVVVASSPSIACCFTPDAILNCFLYLLLFPRPVKVELLTRYWTAEGFMAIKERIEEEEEDLTTLEKKVDALLTVLQARSMVELDEVGVSIPESIAEKARDLVMSTERRSSTHGRFWMHDHSLPTENSGEWEDIQRMAIWNIEPSAGLSHTTKFPKLSSLLLEGIYYGTVLPNHFIFEQMQGLRVLLLSYLDIRFLPLSFSCLKILRFLSIQYCELLESLLPYLKALDKLEFLHLDHARMESIPDECLQHKRNLRSLHINCMNIRSLPSSYLELHRLDQLTVTWCSSLTEIPDTFFEHMQRLRVLNLGYNSKLQSLPSSLSKLVDLKQLILTECSSLKFELKPHLQKFSTLEVLDLCHCESIKDIRDVSSSLGVVLPNLRELNLSKITAIEQVFLKGCQSLASACLSHLTGLSKLDLSGTQLQQLPQGISNASHLRCLDMLQMNHIRKIDWDDISIQLEELNFNHCRSFISPEDDENPKNEGGAHMRISNYKLLQSLKPSSKLLRSKSFSRFHIHISPYQEEEGEGIHLRGRKYIYKNIDLKTQTSKLPHPSGHFDRHLEIRGGKKCPKGIHGVLSCTELLTLSDNAFVRKLSDLGDVEMNELRECLIKKCEQMEIFFGGKNQCFEKLEKILISDLASLRRVCDVMDNYMSFPLLKHICLESCLRLINFCSSSVSLPSLEKLEIIFCSKLESVFQGDVVAVDGSLRRLQKVHLWELPTLERICSGRYIPALKMLTVRGCGKLKELPLRDIKVGGSVEVGGELGWWKNLRWEDESIKQHIHFREWRPFYKAMKLIHRDDGLDGLFAGDYILMECVCVEGMVKFSAVAYHWSTSSPMTPANGG